MPLSTDLTAGRLFETALGLFAARGYPAVSPADIAAAAQCPLDDLYRHFPRKERFILRLYEQLAGDFEARVPELPSGTVAERFAVALRAKLAHIAPHRSLFRSVVPAALDPSDRLAILGPASAQVRARVLGVFTIVAHGATDAPAGKVDRVARFLYAAHLLCVFLAIQDESDSGTLADDGVAFVIDLTKLAVRALGPGPGLLGRMFVSAAGLPDIAGLAERADRIAAALVQPPHDPAHFTLAENILRDLFRHRRLQPGAGKCAKEPCPQCLALHLPRVQAAIAAGQPLRLVLPAFPAKSANPAKTLGPLPDLGEELALRFLQERCDAVREVYAPGASLTICSDGRVFNDLVGVADAAVTAYRHRIIELVETLGLSSIDVFDLDDVRPGEAFDSTRRWLADTYAESRPDLEQRVKTFDHHRQLFNGIHRFLSEDLAGREPLLSKNKCKELSKDAAYEVIRRSNAWSRLVAVYFPDAVRLSIHPQPPHSEKVGILLTPSEDAWLTPWHGAVLLRGDRFVLTKRADAEGQGATIVERDGRPSHLEFRNG